MCRIVPNSTSRGRTLCRVSSRSTPSRPIRIVSHLIEKLGGGFDCASIEELNELFPIDEGRIDQNQIVLAGSKGSHSIENRR